MIVLSLDPGTTHTGWALIDTAGTLSKSVEALRARSLPIVGVVVGSWPQAPDEPDLAMRENLADLPRVAGVPLLGVLPEGAGSLAPADFQVAALEWLAV